MPHHDADSLFHCRQCGHCCEGRGGIVVSPADLERLAAFLHLAAETVVERYCEMTRGKLKIRNGEDGRCIFFQEGTGCAVHEGKPSICRAWPFFRGNIEDPVSLAPASPRKPRTPTSRAPAAPIWRSRACSPATRPARPTPLCFPDLFRNHTNR